MPLQIREFAERVLFGDTIEDKLSFPREEIIDTDPGSAIAIPRTLTRPRHLALREDGVRADHPSIAKLVNERERGRLLHFFGNHELLATELMALALLRFPDAPCSFRQGILQTLKEEQIHTRLYMHRMAQCGVEFGELPLSDYFWKSVSSMHDPLDYVTRLSLTFEQANLDYSLEYKGIFDSIGDSATASILDRIYHDEIEHVGFGLRWFRKWKRDGESDWNAYSERLRFPLSPSRAKGNLFNARGREKAGFKPEFISNLRISNQSRGRTPAVHWFNPNAEFYALKGQTEVDSADSRLQSDLAFLPAYLSRKDDLLLVPEMPSTRFLQGIQSYGFHLPELRAIKNEGQPAIPTPTIDRKIGDLRPWAWTPDSVAFFKRNIEKLTRPRNAAQYWNDGVRNLFSKQWSVHWAAQLANEQDDFDWVADPEIYGHPTHDLEEIEVARTRLSNLGYLDIALKAPFSLSAIGIRCLMRGEEFSDALRAWLGNTWKEQDIVILEPWLERVFDFSIQMEMRKESLKILGFVQLANNPRGQFHGAISNGFCKGVPPEVSQFLLKPVEGIPRLYKYYEDTVVPSLENELRKLNYEGPLGIDAFVYRDNERTLKLKPVVEINPRYTMGRIAMELGQRIGPRSLGLFQIYTRSRIQKIGSCSIAEYGNELANENPIELTSEARPRIASGSLPLVDPELAKQFLAVLHVREDARDLPIPKMG